MAVYKTFTIKTGKNYVVFYYCSECKQLNIFEHNCTATHTYNDRGRFITKTGHELETLDLKYKAEQLESAIRMDEKYGNYRKAAYSHSCEHCGHTEPWAKMNFPVEDLLYRIGKGCLTIALVITAVLFLGSPALALYSLPVWLTGGALMLGSVLKKKQKVNNLESEIAKLDKINRPRSCWSQGEYEKMYEEMLKMDPCAEKD